MIEKLIPEPVHEYVREHPQVLVWSLYALVAFNLYNLWESMGVLVKAQAAIRSAASDAAYAASEALGG